MTLALAFIGVIVGANMVMTLFLFEKVLEKKDFYEKYRNKEGLLTKNPLKDKR